MEQWGCDFQCHAQFTLISTAPFVTQEGNWTWPGFDDMYDQALATVDPAARQQVWDDLQLIFWEHGNWIQAASLPTLDAARSNISGIPPGTWWLGRYSFNDVTIGA